MMVSLSRNTNQSIGGGFAFSGEGSVNVDEDEIRILQPVLGEDSDSTQFRPLKTIPVVAVYLTISLIFGAIAITMGFIWPTDRERCEPFYLLIYMQGGFWIITMIVQFYLRSRHHRLRVAGYLDFYLDMLVLYKMPAHVVTLCSVLLLVVCTLMQQLYRQLEVQCQPPTRLVTPVIYLGVILACQAIVLTICLIPYIRRVWKFNSIRPPPDVEREEWLTSLMDETYRRSEVGFRERRGQTEELLERQADLIRHLQDHNAYLGLKVNQLSARLSGDHD